MGVSENRGYPRTIEEETHETLNPKRCIVKSTSPLERLKAAIGRGSDFLRVIKQQIGSISELPNIFHQLSTLNKLLDII